MTLFLCLLLKLFKTLRPIEDALIDENGPCDFTDYSPFFLLSLRFFSYFFFLFLLLFVFFFFLLGWSEWKSFRHDYHGEINYYLDIIKHSPKIGRTRAILAHSFSFFLSFFLFFSFLSFFNILLSHYSCKWICLTPFLRFIFSHALIHPQ